MVLCESTGLHSVGKVDFSERQNGSKMSFNFTVSGDFKNTEKFLRRAFAGDFYSKLDQYGRIGVNALRKATPKESGKTATAWGYRVIRSRTNPGVEWYNTHVNDGVQIAILIQYGHGTGTGGYVQGRDFINPAMQPVFDQIAQDIWKEVMS